MCVATARRGPCARASQASAANPTAYVTYPASKRLVISTYLGDVGGSSQTASNENAPSTTRPLAISRSARMRGA